MEQVILTIERDLVTLGLLMAILGSLIVINTLLGSINAWAWGEWVSKKFWQGILRNVLIALCLALFFIVLEIIPLALERTGIIVPSELVTTLEVLVMVIVCIVKYVKDIYSSFMKLLGVTKEDVNNYMGEQE